MKGTKLYKRISSITAVLLLSASANATDYYVDNVSGNDNASGTSATSAWKTISWVNTKIFQPGDKILFKRGGTWTRIFRPQGQGTSSAPITIDAYGDIAQPLPIISGGGSRDEGTDGVFNTSDDIADGGATILLRNQSYWNIYNLYVTNPSTSAGVRQGIKVVVEDTNGGSTTNTVTNIRIKGVTVQNVKGSYDDYKLRDKMTGGICFLIERPSNIADNLIIVNAAFNNINVEDCTISDVGRVGISTIASFNIRADYNFNQSNYPVDNFNIKRNIVQNCEGDGVIVRYADGPVIESNRAVNCHYQSESLVGHGVALWCRSTNNAVFQFNEVYNTKAVEKDGLALDADLLAKNTLFQYNYSHNNEGGFVLLMRTAENTIVRYNISQRDGQSDLTNRIFHFSKYPTNVSLPADAKIYNNTIYIHDNGNFSTDDKRIAITTFSDSRAVFSNNVFYNGQGASITPPGGGTATWEYNHFANFPSSVIIPSSPTGAYGEGAGVNTNTTGAAGLTNASADVTLNTADVGMKRENGTSPVGSQLDGFKIGWSSSTLIQNKGRLIASNGGRDFWGISVSATARSNRGAHNGCLGCSTTLSYKETGLLLNDLSTTEERKLYPNPVIDILTISNMPAGAVKADIINISGRKVLSSKLVNGTLNVSSLPSGSYLIAFPDHKEIDVFKFVK